MALIPLQTPSASGSKDGRPAVARTGRGAIAPVGAQDEANDPRYGFVRRMLRHGVAIFDNERDPGAGWACACDGEPFYFSAIQELPSDVVWVVSAEWTEYTTRCKQYHNLRRVDYLQTSILRVAADLGLRVDGHHARTAVHALARVVQRALEIAVVSYGWSNPAAELREDSIVDDIRRAIVHAPVPKPHVQTALTAAFQSSSSPQWPVVYEENTIALTLRVNRLAYVQDLLSRPMPDEGWTVDVRGDDFVRTGTSWDSLLDPQRPCLVEATVDFGGMDPDVATLAAFGVQAGKKLMVRRWIAQPELAWLTKVARVQVQTAMVSLGTRKLPPQAQLPAAMTADPLFGLSVSAGLVAQSHFQAMASEVWNQKKHGKTVSAWAVWLRAYDRAEMFALAHRALQAGFVPIAYSGGTVTVKLQKSRLPDLVAFAIANGLAHPVLHPYFVEHGFAQDRQPLEIAA